MSVTEGELEKRAVAPRVTLDYLESQIAQEYYFTALDGVAKTLESEAFAWRALRGEVIKTPLPQSLGLLTFCVLVLKNGFTVTGESACASPENYQPDIGQRIARQNAVSKIWPLLGYELRSRLAQGESQS